MDVTEKDAVGPGRLLTVVERQRDDVLEERRVFKRLNRRVEVALVRQMDALQDRPLGVEQITFVALAGEAVLRQAAVGAGARPAPTAQVEAQLLAASIAPGTRVGAFRTQDVQLLVCVRLCAVVYLNGWSLCTRD